MCPSRKLHNINNNYMFTTGGHNGLVVSTKSMWMRGKNTSLYIFKSYTFFYCKNINYKLFIVLTFLAKKTTQYWCSNKNTEWDLTCIHYCWVVWVRTQRSRSCQCGHTLTKSGYPEPTTTSSRTLEANKDLVYSQAMFIFKSCFVF